MHKHSISSLLNSWVLGTLLTLPATAVAYQYEWLVFPNLIGMHRNSEMEGHPKDVLEPSADAFFTASHERARFLAEISVDREHSVLERMQIGWLPADGSTIWLGRFHNPLGFWNAEFHHGNYLTTTISRPSIIAFEDHGGGVLPMHISGVLLEGNVNSPISYSISLGIGPTLGITGLMPVDLLNPTEKHGRFAASANMKYQPIAESMGEFGIFASHATIPGDNLPVSVGPDTISEVRQTLIGAEANKYFGNLRLIGELYIVNNRVSSTLELMSNTFTSGYIQADYSIQPKWTLFGRLENTADATDDPYLTLIPDFIKTRTLAGARYAMGQNRSLKLEVSHNELQDKSSNNQLAIEWSAVFP